MIFSKTGLGVIVTALVLGLFAYYAHTAKIRTLERDAVRALYLGAEAARTAQATLDRAKIDALQKKMEDDNDRTEFTKDAAAAIARGRVDGDGALAPVLRDTAGRVRQRYQEFNAQHRDP